MKRDMDLVREILFFVEKIDPSSPSFPNVVIEGRDKQLVRGHCIIMQDAGLIVGSLTEDGFQAERLTWLGQEYISVMRSLTV